MIDRVKPWYSPREIVYSSTQMLWLLEHLVELRQGLWPAQPGVTQGEPVGKRLAPAPRAHFEKAVIESSELDRRLDSCKIDGMLTELFYTHKVDEAVLAARLGKSFQEIRGRISSCLRHITDTKGRKVKGHSYRRGNYRR